MAIEKFWTGVSSQSFTSNGGTRGQVTLTSTAGFKVKMDVIVTSGTQPTLELEVKRVVSGTLLEVGPKNDALNKRTKISAYTTGDGAAITANLQPRSNIPLKDINRAVYEEEPTVAIRVVQVDQFGNILGGTGGVASDVNISDGFGNAITSTTVGMDQALDVNLVNTPIDVNISSVGTEADVFSDSIGDGLVDVTDTESTVVERAVGAGSVYNVHGWRVTCDEQTQFVLEIADSGVRTEVLDVILGGDVRAGDARNFLTPIEVTGADDRTVRIRARTLNPSASGQAAAGINGFTT